MFPFDPPENIRKLKVFWCLQGDQNGTLGREGLNTAVHYHDIILPNFTWTVACCFHINPLHTTGLHETGQDATIKTASETKGAWLSG